MKKAGSKQDNVRLVVVGSVAVDTIETPYAKRADILGGSASYACAAASFFTHVGMVGVVGSDFPKPYRRLYQKFGVDLEGLQVKPGRTFRWSGVYEDNMDRRRTLKTELNVFGDFSPELPESYRESPYVLLGNISPSLQLHVLDQVRKPKFVVMDTMDLWINETEDELLKVIGCVDMLTLNESEARHLSGHHTLVKAAQRLLSLGPRYVLIKKGEHGSMLFSAKGVFLMPAFPLEDVRDPTGAGDAFAGGFMGALALHNRVDEKALRKAMLYGSVVASFSVEEFSLERLARINLVEIEERACLFRQMLKAG